MVASMSRSSAFALGLNATDDVPRKPLRQESRGVVHVEDEADLVLLFLAFGFNGLRSEPGALYAFHFNIGRFNQNTQHVGASVVDVGEKRLGVVAFSDGCCDLVHIGAGFGCEGSEIRGQLDALEAVEVGLDFNGFNVQFLGKEVVEFAEVRAATIQP